MFLKVNIHILCTLYTIHSTSYTIHCTPLFHQLLCQTFFWQLGTDKMAETTMPSQLGWHVLADIIRRISLEAERESRHGSQVLALPEEGCIAVEIVLRCAGYLACDS